MGCQLPATFASAILLFAATSSLGAQAVFRWLPPLPLDSGTYASGISADGSVVVGQSHGVDSSAVFWKRAGPAQALGVLEAGNTFNAALAASADGSVIVGYVASHPGNSYVSQTFRWTAQSGMVALGEAPAGVLDNQARGVSDDGSVIVGQYRGPRTPALQNDAFLWTQGDGFEELPALMPQYAHYNRAIAVSGDGSVVVGACGYGGAFRWTRAAGIQSLYGLDTNGLAYASAISADGRFIVGGSGMEAFLWRQGSGVQWLGVPEDKDWSWANDVSDDGRVVVGGSEYEGRPNEAIIWTAEGGLRYLREMLLADYGVSIPPEALLEATGISADGRVITGNGGALGAWVVSLPEPSGLLLGLGAWMALRLRNRQRSRAEQAPGKENRGDPG